MPTEKSFNPDYHYSFWFYKHKFAWIMEMCALLIGYDFAAGEVKGMELALEVTNDQDTSKWRGGLHYGDKGTMYLNLALDAENRDIVHVSISTNKTFEKQLEFIDVLQCTYEGFYKYVPNGNA